MSDKPMHDRHELFKHMRDIGSTRRDLPLLSDQERLELMVATIRAGQGDDPDAENMLLEYFARCDAHEPPRLN